MVEISVVVAEPTLAHGLIVRLGRTFDPSSVSYDWTRREVRVCSEWESRTVAGVVEVVQQWVEEVGAASATLAVGDRSYTLVGVASA